jgi:hypothetical protein
MAISGLCIDRCQNQKQHKTDAQNKTFPFHVTPPICSICTLPNSWFAQIADKAKGVPGLIASRATCTKGLIGLCFSKEGLFRILILPATAGSGFKKKYQFFPTGIREMQKMYHPQPVYPIDWVRVHWLSVLPLSGRFLLPRREVAAGSSLQH